MFSDVNFGCERQTSSSLNHGRRNNLQREWWLASFKKQVQPVGAGAGSMPPLPQVANKTA